MFKDITGIGIDCYGPRQQQRALELTRIDDFGCWFEGHGGTLSDPEDVVTTFGRIQFFVFPGFEDLLDWVQTGRAPGNLAQRKQDLYNAKKTRN